jgi:hypothetical protein
VRKTDLIEDILIEMRGRPKKTLGKLVKRALF